MQDLDNALTTMAQTLDEIAAADPSSEEEVTTAADHALTAHTALVQVVTTANGRHDTAMIRRLVEAVRTGERPALESVGISTFRGFPLAKNDAMNTARTLLSFVIKNERDAALQRASLERWRQDDPAHYAWRNAR